MSDTKKAGASASLSDVPSRIEQQYYGQIDQRRSQDSPLGIRENPEGAMPEFYSAATILSSKRFCLFPAVTGSARKLYLAGASRNGISIADSDSVSCV